LIDHHISQESVRSVVLHASRKTDNEAQIFNPTRRREVGNVTMSKILSFKVPPKEKNKVFDCLVTDEGLFVVPNRHQRTHSDSSTLCCLDFKSVINSSISELCLVYMEDNSSRISCSSSSSFKNCKDTLTPLHEAIDNVKSAKVMLDLQKSIMDLQVNIQKVLNFQTSNMDSLSKQKLLCQKEIRETRQDINKKLDELEQDILDELSSIYTKHNSEIEELITDLKSRQQRVDESECVL
jgi:hypothetical protein